MTALLIAHAGHWLTSVLYLLPGVGFLVWLAVVTIRERRSEDDEEMPDPAP